MLVNLVRRSELICVYRAPDIQSFRSEVGAISSQSVGVGSNGSYGQSDVQALMQSCSITSQDVNLKLKLFL